MRSYVGTYTLLNRGEVLPKSEYFGKALEHLIFLELLTYKNYRELDFSFRFWRLLISTEKNYRKTEDNIEVYPVSDFLKELWNGDII